MNENIDMAIKTIRDATEAIATEEPEDIERMRHGILPSDAGSEGQYLSTLLFAQSEVRGLSYYAIPGILKFTHEDISTDHLCNLANTLLTRRAGFVGYCGLYDWIDVFETYFDALEHVETKDEFLELTQELNTYANKMHDWMEFAFPWEIGTMFPQKSSAEIDQLQDLFIEYDPHYYTV